MLYMQQCPYYVVRYISLFYPAPRAGCNVAPDGCGENQEMFKGAFMRHLGYLRRSKGLSQQRRDLYTARLPTLPKSPPTHRFEPFSSWVDTSNPHPTLDIILSQFS